MESIIGVVSDIEQAFQKARALINNSGKLSEKLNDPYGIDDRIFSLNNPGAHDTNNNEEMFSNIYEVSKIPSPRKPSTNSPSKSPRKAIKQLSSEHNALYVIDDPIVSLHDPESRESFRDEEMCSNTNEVYQTVSPGKHPTQSPSKSDKKFSSEHLFDSQYQEANRWKDVFPLPFLGNPIQNTIAEMQRELNKRGDITLPITGPSTEAISCLYNRDQGICLPGTASSKKTKHLQNYDLGDLQLAKPNKKEKKLKTEKSKQGKKAEKKKKKITKTDSTSSQDNKMRELMNIYGVSGKIGNPHSDSTLGSKSALSKHSSKKLKNSSSRMNNSEPSKKGKIKKQKLPDKYNNDLYGDNFAEVERESRISSKRKSSQKDSSKLIKKTNLKRKIGAKLSNDNMDLKLSKNNQNNYRDVNNNISKYNPYSKEKYKQPYDIRHNQYNSLKANDAFERNKETNNKNSNNNNKSILNPINYTKHQYGIKSNVTYNQHSKQANRNYDPMIKPSQITSNEKVLNFLNKSSENLKLGMEVNVVKSNERMAEGDHEVLNSLLNDLTQKEFGTHASQMHYSLPTHSSRMKEAERFLHGSFQSFPFVIGQSTSKSHNLFVNIQETLSLMKQKLPPTIEIETVNCYEGERPCSPTSVMSKFTMRSVGSKKPHRCPALGAGLYDIPEGTAETEEGVIKSWEDHPDCIKANTDPESVRPRCMCEPKSTMSRKNVLHQVLGENGESMAGMEGDVAGQDGDNYFRELRKTLMIFSQEFEELNNKYEELLKKPDALKEDIERLELQLENKEEEIKEIIARIKEFKELSEKGGGRLRQPEPDHYRSASTASFQLATLRRVQLLRDSLISRPSVPYLAKNVYTKHTLK